MLAPATAAKYPNPVHKLLQVARHRVIRWFRPPPVERRRQCAGAAPHPALTTPSRLPRTENRHEHA